MQKSELSKALEKLPEIKRNVLLRLLVGLETATEGEILNDGEVIGNPSLNKGVVFQDYGLFPWMTAGENIMLALKQKFPKRDKKE